jgi:hypothetical protein
MDARDSGSGGREQDDHSDIKVRCQILPVTRWFGLDNKRGAMEDPDRHPSRANWGSWLLAAGYLLIAIAVGLVYRGPHADYVGPPTFREKVKANREAGIRRHDCRLGRRSVLLTVGCTTVGAVLVAGCSYTYEGEAPDAPLVIEPAPRPGGLVWTPRAQPVAVGV